MVEWIIRAQQQAWLHTNTTQTARQRFPSPSPSLPLPSAPPGTSQPTETDTAMPLAICFYTAAHTAVCQSSFQVSIKISNPSATQPPVSHAIHWTDDDLSETQQSAESSWRQRNGCSWAPMTLFYDTALPKWGRWYNASNMFKSIWYLFKILCPGIPLWLWDSQKHLESSGT